MKKLILPLLAALLLTACGQAKENAQGAEYGNITAEEAKRIMDREGGYGGRVFRHQCGWLYRIKYKI